MDKVYSNAFVYMSFVPNKERRHHNYRVFFLHRIIQSTLKQGRSYLIGRRALWLNDWIFLQMMHGNWVYQSQFTKLNWTSMKNTHKEKRRMNCKSWIDGSHIGNNVLQNKTDMATRTSKVQLLTFSYLLCVFLDRRRFNLSNQVAATFGSYVPSREHSNTHVEPSTPLYNIKS